MPRKIQELKAQIARGALFICPNAVRAAMSVGDIHGLDKTLTIPGKDGDDVPLYLEKQLEKLLAELEDLREEGNL